MIDAVLVMNTQGKPRLTKFYRHVPLEKEQEIIRAVYAVLSSRAESFCSFVEADNIFGPGRKLVYKPFATLYFVFVIDGSESELGILDLIQVFVETLDRIFKNVCELDIVYNFNKVHTVLDEIIMGGQVVETNSAEIVKTVQDIFKVGDGPIVGAAAYADTEVGACGATGDGDIMMRFLPCYQVVESMRRGMHPKDAAVDAIVRIREKFPSFIGALFAVDKNGMHAGACHGWTFQYSMWKKASKLNYEAIVGINSLLESVIQKIKDAVMN